MGRKVVVVEGRGVTDEVLLVQRGASQCIMLGAKSQRGAQREDCVRLILNWNELVQMWMDSDVADKGLRMGKVMLSWMMKIRRREEEQDVSHGMKMRLVGVWMLWLSGWLLPAGVTGWNCVWACGFPEMLGSLSEILIVMRMMMMIVVMGNTKVV